jgi:hypothetical protein
MLWVQVKTIFHKLLETVLAIIEVEPVYPIQH